MEDSILLLERKKKGFELGESKRRRKKRKVLRTVL